MKYLYTIFGLVVILTYGWIDLRGLELRQTKRSFVPQGLRSTQSGARSFWYRGYQGGK